MIYWRLFSKFAQIHEVGKLSPSITKQLNILNDTNNYKPFLKEKILKSLNNLYSESKKSYDFSQIKWNDYKEIQQAKAQLPALISSFDLRSTISLMRLLIKFRFFDTPLWESLEESLLSTHRNSIDNSRIEDIIKLFSSAKQGSAQFWKSVEDIIVSRLCPQHSMSGHTVATIISTFTKKKLANHQLLSAMEQQVLRTSIQLSGTDVARILYSFGIMRVGSEQFYNELNKQCRLTKSQMDVYSLVISLTTFCKMKNGTDDLYEDLESSVMLLKNTLTLQNISCLIYAYAKYIPNMVRTGKRRKIPEFLETHLSLNLKRLIKNSPRDADKMIMNCLWGLCHCDIVSNKPLLKDLAEHYNEITAKTNEYDWMKKSIEKILLIN